MVGCLGCWVWGPTQRADEGVGVLVGHGEEAEAEGRHRVVAPAVGREGQ